MYYIWLETIAKYMFIIVYNIGFGSQIIEVLL